MFSVRKSTLYFILAFPAPAWRGNPNNRPIIEVAALPVHIYERNHQEFTVRTYVRMYVRMYVRTCICMYICTYVCMYVRMYVRTYVCTYICTYVCMYVCMYVCTYVCMYASMYVCMYVRMYVGHLESKERLRIQPAQLFNFS